MKHSYFVFAAVIFLFSLLQPPAAISGTPTPVLQPQESPSAPAPSSVGSSPAITPQTPPPQSQSKIVTAYTLPPDLYKKAHDLGRIHFRFALISFFYGLVVLWIALAGKLAAKYRAWAEVASSRRFLQALIFSPLLIATMSVLTLPADIYEQNVERVYGLSIQGWGSWAWDWVKALLIGVVISTILIWILYGVIRKSPRRWWFYFWLATIPIAIFLVFLAPVVIDPMFHKFEPLQTKDPGLTAALESMVQRAGQDIPPERMFWMGAGEKSTQLNAYVTGIGASKRIVVWDNTIAKMTTPQIVFVAGHEMGHYVLHHIWKGLVSTALLLFVLFYLGFRSIGWLLDRWGAGWEIRALDDWASLPALLLLLSVFSFVFNPIDSAVSRYYEHQADQYGLEVTHGLAPGSSQLAAQSFQILGEVDLSDPDPNPVNVFLFFSHPPISDRVRFALSYDPWANGGQGEFVH
jgi:Zn-dependent protease with chaperone function